MLKQITGSNAQRVISQIKAKLREFEKEFPKGIHYSLSYDVSRFLDASTDEVINTLRDAFILVSLVVLLFLGDVRSTLVPIIAVPVSLIGSFFFALAFGLSINMVVLFALVLANGPFRCAFGPSCFLSAAGNRRFAWCPSFSSGTPAKS